MNKIARLLIPATAALLLAGCGSTPYYGAANIHSIPEGAEIVNLKDNSHLGVTPAKISFPGNPDTAEQVTIQLQKPGYLDRITSFWINRRHDNRTDALAQPIDVKVELEKE
jgi:hypothetical protein